MNRRMFAGLGFVLALMLGLGLRGTVFAHAKLVSAVPASGARLTAAPTKVTLVFTEEVSDKADETYFTVTDAMGMAVSIGKLDNTDTDHKTVSGTLQGSMGDGVYTVTWHTVTPDDGGITNGKFTFGVNADPGPQSDVEGVEEPEEAEATTAATTAQPTMIAGATQPAATTVATPQATAAAGGVTPTLPTTGEGDPIVLWPVLVLAVVALVGGLALRRSITRTRQ